MNNQTSPFVTVTHTPSIFSRSNYPQTRRWLVKVLNGERLEKVGAVDNSSAQSVKKRITTLLKTLYEVVEAHPVVQSKLDKKFPEFKHWERMTSNALVYLRAMREEILYCLELLETQGAERQIYSMAHYVRLVQPDSSCEVSRERSCSA